MNSGKSSVLFVDDDHDVVWGMGRCLTRAGFLVATCSDGAEAISLLDSRSFDVVVTDIRMPAVSGLALSDWLRKHQPQTKVIVMTAFGSTAMRQLSLRKGAFEYLEKPVDPEVLVEIISAAKRKGTFSGSINNIGVLDYMQLGPASRQGSNHRSACKRRRSRTDLRTGWGDSPRHLQQFER